MARIADQLLLLLLDNATARPAIDQPRRRRLLAAAVLLDLAYGCRIRPGVTGEPNHDRLIALVTPHTAEPPQNLAWELLARKPISPRKAVGKLERRIEPELFEQLESTGQLRRVMVYTRPSGSARAEPAWPLTDLGRAHSAVVRTAMLATLCGDTPAEPIVAALITLLHTVDGLGPLLSLDPAGWAQADDMAAEIASGSWITETSGLDEMNLAVTAAAVRTALRR